MKTILVTGGAGFIGYSICQRLLDQGDQVLCVDSLTDYYDPQKKMQRVLDLSNCKQKDQFHFFKCDIRDESKLDEIFDQWQIDAVVHLAAYAGVRPSIENPTLYFDVNVMGTLCLQSCMQKHKITSLVFASSSSVYGDQTQKPFQEQMCTDYPISPYAASKKSGETLCYTFHHLYQMRTICLRFFTVFGPGQRPDLAIHRFANQIEQNQPITLFGDGKSQRDYTYIDDIASGVISAVSWSMQPKAAYEIVNLGGNHPIQLSEMLECIEKHMGKKALIQYLPDQSGDVSLTYADISKAKRLLGYNPQTSFDDGIKKFIDWFKQEQTKKPSAN